MMKTWAALAAGIAMLLVQGVARADVFSVTADVPVSLALKLDNTTVGNSVSGYAVGVSLPFLIGFGVEGYKATMSKKDFGAKGDLNFNLVDVFVNLPIPVVNIALGLGAGTATFDPDKFSVSDPVLGNGTLKFGSAPLTQYFASVGIPIAKVFDVHVGYHVLSGKFDEKGSFASGNSKVSADLKANMLSVGAKIGF